MFDCLSFLAGMICVFICWAFYEAGKVARAKEAVTKDKGRGPEVRR